MKRIRLLQCLFIVSFIVFSLTACGKDDPEPIVPNPDYLEIGEYSLLYKNAKIMTDYQGNDALVITLDYTNNSESNDSYLRSVIESAVQNDTALELGIVYVNEETLEMVTDSQVTEIAPGETIEVQSAFELLDTTNEVVVTFEDIYDGNKKNIVINPSTLSRETADAAKSTNSSDSTKSNAANTSASAAVDDELIDWWNGDWYGWWTMTGCSGKYEDLNGMWWDICGNIEIGDDYIGTVTLWDEFFTKSDPMVIASVSLSDDGISEHGTLMSEGGYFDYMSLEYGDWIVDTGLDEFEGMIHIGGYYEDEEGTYYYDIYMCPWGFSWENLGEEFMPYYYYEWYLPLIEAGEAMPDSIEVG